MFVLAHLSDLHMALRPRLLELAGKRGLGYINWHRGRRSSLRGFSFVHHLRSVSSTLRPRFIIEGDS